MHDPTEPLAWVTRAEEDLAALSDLCLQNELIVPVDRDALECLTAYAVQVRYPGEDPTPDEAREALQVAQAVRRFARRLLNPLR
jgi:HEPN domain-containing protein